MIEEQSNTVRSVAWFEVFPWLNLVRVFRLAISVRGLVLGAVGMLLTVLCWGLIARVFCPAIFAVDSADATHPTTWLKPVAEQPWMTMTKTLPDATVQYPFSPEAANAQSSYMQKDPVTVPWAMLTTPAWKSLSSTGFALHDAVCLILCGLTGVAIWAFFGAAICRTAAVRLAADEQMGLGAALRFACRKWPAYFAAPLLPVSVVMVVTIVISVLGLIMKANAGLLLAGCLWPLVLVAGFAMAVLLLGVLFGFPLMWGTISAEGTDSFDALSRSYAYVFQRPFRYLFYIVVAAFLGWIGWILVWRFAEGVIWLGYWAAGWGCGDAQFKSIYVVPGEDLNVVGRFGVHVIHFFAGCVKLLAVGYMFSYFWTASSAIYLLLRHDVDATEMDEVFLDADATEQESDLPAIAADQSASPVVGGESTEVTVDGPR